MIDCEFRSNDRFLQCRKSGTGRKHALRVPVFWRRLSDGLSQANGPCGFNGLRSPAPTDFVCRSHWLLRKKLSTDFRACSGFQARPALFATCPKLLKRTSGPPQSPNLVQQGCRGFLGTDFLQRAAQLHGRLGGVSSASRPDVNARFRAARFLALSTHSGPLSFHRAVVQKGPDGVRSTRQSRRVGGHDAEDDATRPVAELQSASDRRIDGRAADDEDHRLQTLSPRPVLLPGPA